MSLIRMSFNDVRYALRGKVLSKCLFNLFDNPYNALIYHFQTLVSKFIKFKPASMYSHHDSVEYWNAVESVNIHLPYRARMFWRWDEPSKNP